jgi:hypothetical protein
MLQAAVLDWVAFDPFSFQQDGLPASEVVPVVNSIVLAVD